jgi:hypothetical protein
MSKATTTRNRHDKVAAIDLIASVVLKRPAHNTHIKVNPRKKVSTKSSGPSSQDGPRRRRTGWH